MEISADREREDSIGYRTGRRGRGFPRLPSSLAGRITLLSFAISTALTVAVAAIHLGAERTMARAEMDEKLTLIARAIGRQSASAIAHGDVRKVEETLAALAMEPIVASASMLRPDGRVLAHYAKSRDDRSVLEGSRSPPDGRGMGFRSQAGWLEVTLPVRSQNRVIGTMLVVADMREVQAGQRAHLIAVCLVGLAVITCALVLTRLLLPRILRPVEHLAKLARCISEEKRYDLKAPEKIGAEAASLAEAFNAMLGQIRQRDAELAEVKRSAEDVACQMGGLLEKSRQTNLELEREIREHRLAQGELLVKSRELERSNRELNQFAYVASHDLQEPLRMVTMFTQLLKRRYADDLDAAAVGYIDFAVDGAMRMRRLIQDLLEYSRVGRATLDFSSVNCVQLMRSVLGNLRVAMTESGARVRVGDLPTLEANPTGISQLLQNLIANAIKFRGDGVPEIHISAQPQAERWLFAVRDNGIGIAPEFRERIFLVFQRLHTRDEYEGTGIGLALCKRIVDCHGGEIWVESAPGAGSSFFFTLPCRQTAAQPAPSAGVRRVVDASATSARPKSGAEHTPGA